MRYADTSALVKLVVDEEESEAVRARLIGTDSLRCVTSIIARAEIGISIARRGADPTRTLADDGILLHVRGTTVTLIGVDPTTARLAAGLGADHGLRSLDALHVATAVGLGPRLTEVVTYDHRMAAACAALGIASVSPSRST